MITISGLIRSAQTQCRSLLQPNGHRVSNIAIPVLSGLGLLIAATALSPPIGISALSICSAYWAYEASRWALHPANSDVKINEDENNLIDVVIPSACLAPGEVNVVATQEAHSRIRSWTREMVHDTHKKIFQIVCHWRSLGIQDYFICAEERPEQTTPFRWRVIPFPPTGSALFQQLRVMWRLIFGASTCTKRSQNNTVRAMEGWTHTKRITIDDARNLSNDILCTEAFHDNQGVLQYKDVSVAYSRAPIVDPPNCHLLLIPKNHYERWEELPRRTYRRVLKQLQSSSINNQGFYVFDKTGRRTGQTIPHWYAQLIVLEQQPTSFWGKLRLLKHILFGAPSLPNETLQERVDQLKPLATGE